MILSLEFLIIGILAGYLLFSKAGQRSFIFSQEEKGGLWSLGIYSGSSPFDLYSDRGPVKNPVLSARDVHDVKAKFLADPFIIKDSTTWHMFFEIYDEETNHTLIGRGESRNGMQWEYKRAVLREKFGMSYPFVFKYGNSYYMMPECHLTNNIKLYKAEKFPDKWKFVKNLIAGDLADPTFFVRDGTCWLFASNGDSTLRLFHADNLMGPWKEHPGSPVIRNANFARCGGNVFEYNGGLYRLTQDDKPFYGSQVRCFEIKKLSRTEYEEQEVDESPLLRPSRIDKAWNGRGMHTLCVRYAGLGLWIASVDGL